MVGVNMGSPAWSVRGRFVEREGVFVDPEVRVVEEIILVEFAEVAYVVEVDEGRWWR